MRTRVRRTAAVTALILAASLPMFAAETVRKQGTFEFFIGPYTVTDPLFKEVYPQGANTIRGVLLSSAIVAGVDFYAQIKAFYKTGALTYTQEETKFLMIPLSLGLRYELGRAHELCGNTSAALACFSEVLAINPTFRDVVSRVSKLRSN